MRRIAAIAAAVLLVFSISACAGSPTGSPPPASDKSESSASEGATGAIGLIGLWRVSDAEGESADTWLRMDGAELNLWRGCRIVMGSWRADEASLIASLWGETGSCVVADGVPRVEWLERVASYEPVDGGWALRDIDGEVVARLSVDGAPAPLETFESYAEVPVPDEAAREALLPAAPLPDGLRPATSDDLSRHWVPLEATDPDAEAMLAADGTWTGSDGCNGASGRWSVRDGRFLATAGPTTLIGCGGVPVPGWVASARLAGFDDDQLVLLDQHGDEIGRLLAS